MHAAGVELRGRSSGVVVTAGPQEEPGGSQQHRQGQQDQESALRFASHNAIYGVGFVLASKFMARFNDWVLCLEQAKSVGGSTWALQPEVVRG